MLKERNMLLTIEEWFKEQYELTLLEKSMPNPDRLERVEESMANLETVVRERNQAALELEYGHTGERKSKDITTFLGFKQRSYAIFSWLF